MGDCMVIEKEAQKHLHVETAIMNEDRETEEDDKQ